MTTVQVVGAMGIGRLVAEVSAELKLQTASIPVHAVFGMMQKVVPVANALVDFVEGSWDPIIDALLMTTASVGTVEDGLQLDAREYVDNRYTR